MAPNFKYSKRIFTGSQLGHYKVIFSVWFTARINFSRSNLWRLFGAEPGLVDVSIRERILRLERRVASLPLVNCCVVLGKYQVLDPWIITTAPVSTSLPGDFMH